MSVNIHTGRNKKKESRPRTWRRRRWWIFVSFSTFLEKMFCKLNPSVEMRAEMSPTMSKEISVRVAIKTPEMIGTKLTYTDVGCFSFMITRERTTVKSGIVAFTKSLQSNWSDYFSCVSKVSANTCSAV
jgi:hypothetical protein